MDEEMAYTKSREPWQPQAVADNMPEVCCEQCEHWRPQDATGDPNDCCCGNEVLAGHMEHGYNPPARFGCSNWKRRQP